MAKDINWDKIAINRVEDFHWYMIEALGFKAQLSKPHETFKNVKDLCLFLNKKIKKTELYWVYMNLTAYQDFKKDAEGLLKKYKLEFYGANLSSVHAGIPLHTDEGVAGAFIILTRYVQGSKIIVVCNTR